MSAIPNDKLDRLVQRWETIQAELNQGGVNQATFAKLNKEFSDLNPLIETINTLRAAEQEERDLEAMARDATADKEMVALAREELSAVRERLDTLKAELKIALLHKDAAEDKSAIIEVRAGTGGD